MTKGQFALEEFGAKPRRPKDRSVEDASLAEAQLEAFDKGYREGWEDAAKAHAEEQKAIGANLARTLEDMSFTYHEARTAMMGEMRGLVLGLVDKVLPVASHESLGATILESIEAAAKARSDVPVEIRVAEGNAARIEAYLLKEAAMRVLISEEPSLGPGQAVLRFGRAEEIIDLGAVLDGIREAVEGFFEGQTAREG